MSGKESRRPYIVALAMMDGTYIVVADENMRRKNRKFQARARNYIFVVLR